MCVQFYAVWNSITIMKNPPKNELFLINMGLSYRVQLDMGLFGEIRINLVYDWQPCSLQESGPADGQLASSTCVNRRNNLAVQVRRPARIWSTKFPFFFSATTPRHRHHHHHQCRLQPSCQKPGLPVGTNFNSVEPRYNELHGK